MKLNRFKKNINIPSEVSVTFKNDYYHFSGPKGQIKHKLHKSLSVEMHSDYLCIFFPNTLLKKREYKKILSLINTTYSLFNNYINGILNFFHRKLKLKGIGYKAKCENNCLHLQLGFSHVVKINIPNDIFIDILDLNSIIVKGVSKDKVGKIAFAIKEKRIPEVYKGNGIKYENEIIKLKLPKKSK